MNPQLVALLVGLAQTGSTINYSDLAAHLGVNPRNGLRPLLDAVYEELVRNQHRPDITLLVVYANTEYGNYRSDGLAARSVEFDPSNAADRAAYDHDRQLVYQHDWTDL